MELACIRHPGADNLSGAARCDPAPVRPAFAARCEGEQHHHHHHHISGTTDRPTCQPDAVGVGYHGVLGGLGEHIAGGSDCERAG